jgi:hypothetical protein
MNYKIFIWAGLILILTGPLSAQNDSETRTYIKTLPVNIETSLDVINKYGTVEITSWKKDSAMIRVEVKASASSQSKINKLFDGVSVNITDSNLSIKARTEFMQNINMLFESFKGMTNKLISYESSVEINYFINIPEYLNLKIDNRYGDVYMENVTGDFSISLSNGSFKAGSLSKNSDVRLVFCDATITSLVSGKINASFSEIEIGESAELNINSISSRFEIQNAGSLTTESRRDKFFVNDIETLNGNSYFTDFRLNNLKRKLDLTTKYGSITTDLIDKGFESVEINSVYSDISLEFDPASSYNLDIRQINTFVVLPDKNTKTEKRILNEEKKEFITTGTVGKNPGSVNVKLDANRGNIYLK